MESVKVLIVGGGLTGLLAGEYLRRKGVRFLIIEAAPMNARKNAAFGTQYLWEPVDGLMTSRISVLTQIDGLPPTLSAVNAYRARIGREPLKAMTPQYDAIQSGWQIVGVPSVPVRHRAALQQVDTRTRIAHILAHDTDSDSEPKVVAVKFEELVSTIPLPVMLGCLPSPTYVEPPHFTSIPIAVAVKPLPPDAAPVRPGVWRVNYISNPSSPAYRTTDRNGERHYEWLATDSAGIPDRILRPGKIFAGDDGAYVSLLREQHIHCFGRYATWTPRELTHETAENLRRWVRERF